MTPVSPSTRLQSYYLLYSAKAASQRRLPGSCSSPCPWPCSHASSFALALTVKWAHYEQVQWFEPAKIITIFPLLDPLSVGSVPWADLPSGHTRARNSIRVGRTTKSGEKGRRKVWRQSKLSYCRLALLLLWWGMSPSRYHITRRL